MKKPIDFDLFEMAKNEVQIGHDNKALDLLEQLIADNESQPIDVYLLYCQLLEKSKNHHKATVAYLNLSQLFENTESYTEALKYVDQAYQLDSQNVQTLKQYIRVYECSGELDSAINLLSHHINTEKQKKSLGLLLNLLCKHAMTDAFDTVLEQHKNYFIEHVETLFQHGLTLKKLGHLTAANQVFKLILVQNNKKFNYQKVALLAFNQLQLTFNMAKHADLFLQREKLASMPTEEPVFDVNNPLINDFIKNIDCATDAETNRRLTQYALSNELNEQGLFFKDLVSFAEKINAYKGKFTHNYLQIEADPNEALALAEIIIDKIQTKTPTSIIRLGDGEGIFLDYETFLLQHQKEDMTTIQKRWWGESRIPDSEITGIQNKIKQSINNADVLGIPNLLRMVKSNEQIKTKKSVHHRGLLAINYYLEKSYQPNQNTVLTSCHLQNDFEVWNLYNYIFTDVKRLKIITCHKGVDKLLFSKFGIVDTEVITIPPESFHSHKFGVHQKVNSHYPDFFNQMHQKINCNQGDIYLVAAGFLGKIYCGYIKQSGGIGIDIGSVVDLWMNYKTRKAHKHLQSTQITEFDISNIPSNRLQSGPLNIQN